MVEKTMVQDVASFSVSVSGFSVESASSIDVDETYNLVKGTALKILNPDGEVIHEDVRGFMPLDETYHLVRLPEGSWWYCTSDGKPKRKSALRKKNLAIGDKAVMFDERGKIRLGQQNATYSMLVLR